MLRKKLRTIRLFIDYYRRFYRFTGLIRFFWLQVLGVLSSVFNALGISAVIPFLAAVLANDPNLVLKYFSKPLLESLPTSIAHHIIGISGALLLSAFALKNFILMLFMYLINDTLERYVAHLRNEMNSHYLSSIGKILEVTPKSRMLYLNNQLIQLNSFNYAMVDLNLKLYTMLALGLVTVGISLKLSLLCIILVAALVFLGMPIYQWTRRTADTYYLLLRKLQGLLVSFFEGAEVIKTLRLESKQAEFFNNTQNQIVRSAVRMGLSRQAIFSMPEMVQMVALVGGTLLIRPSPNQAVLLGVFFYSWLKMVSAFNDFNSRLNSAIELKPAPVEVYHYIDRMPSLRAATATRSVENIRKLEIKHVSIRSGEQKILDNFSAEIPLGKKIQILGKNGSGKSSLIKSILGLLPYEGEILINDVDVETFSREGLLQKVSYHSQVPFLFPQTVIENIRLSNPKLSDSEIIKFCEEHALDRFIRNREQGFYAMVSEGGTNLSGGEKQSIALARSLLAESEILILDEYANHLDSETLKRVDSFLARIRNKTVLVISHQAASFCEVQIKMEKGRLVSITENLAPALTQET